MTEPTRAPTGAGRVGCLWLRLGWGLLAQAVVLALFGPVWAALWLGVLGLLAFGRAGVWLGRRDG